MTKPRAIAFNNDNRSHPKPSEQHVATVNNWLYFFYCLSKEDTHKIRFMLTYESKVKDPIVEQSSCFLHVVCKTTGNLAP